MLQMVLPKLVRMHTMILFFIFAAYTGLFVLHMMTLLDEFAEECARFGNKVHAYWCGSEAAKKAAAARALDHPQPPRPAFCEPYTARLTAGQKEHFEKYGKLSKSDSRRGFRVTSAEGEYLTKIYRKEGEVNGVRRKKNVVKFTWEHIKDITAHTYDIGFIRKYKAALTGILQNHLPNPSRKLRLEESNNEKRYKLTIDNLASMSEVIYETDEEEEAAAALLLAQEGEEYEEYEEYYEEEEEGNDIPKTFEELENLAMAKEDKYDVPVEEKVKVKVIKKRLKSVAGVAGKTPQEMECIAMSKHDKYKTTVMDPTKKTDTKQRESIPENKDSPSDVSSDEKKEQGQENKDEQKEDEQKDEKKDDEIKEDEKKDEDSEDEVKEEEEEEIVIELTEEEKAAAKAQEELLAKLAKEEEEMIAKLKAEEEERIKQEEAAALKLAEEEASRAKLEAELASKAALEEAARQAADAAAKARAEEEAEFARQKALAKEEAEKLAKQEAQEAETLRLEAEAAENMVIEVDDDAEEL